MLHLFVGKGLPGFDGGPLAHGGDELFFCLRRQWIVALPQHLQDVQHRSLDIRHDQDRRDRSHEITGSTKRLQLKAGLVEPVQVFGQNPCQQRIKIQGHGLEQRLRLDDFLRDLYHHLFVEDALVGGVLIDEIHALRALGHNVGLSYLADGTQQRQPYRSHGL